MTTVWQHICSIFLKKMREAFTNFEILCVNNFLENRKEYIGLTAAKFIYETKIFTFQKIRTKSLDLSMLHPSEGGKKDQTDYG
jgi:hypothetical protein